ncbi:hypothetical protein LTR56_011097 [Elasticomyces elasticus]|nr:hypothetical protein LTR56_011097 [Elasticomyces elasticus]KAK3662482.1 hypothetical protein LTR22_006761 [Elasticomyces elasticus]KAK4926471.1 hypothetical protein LTR49_006678 [Elasticomyces elasticus]KAK5761155.1 hypothetical protein LTS12_008636 [Elasticomyces elasticus]
MTKDGDAGWQVVGPKKPRKSYRFTTPAEAWMSKETEEPKEQITTYTGGFPFYELPAELRDKVHDLIADDITTVFFNRRVGVPVYGTADRYFCIQAQTIFLQHALTCKQMHKELQAADIRAHPWMYLADDCLNGPSNGLGDDDRTHQIVECTRSFEIKGKLQGHLTFSDNADYSFGIHFAKKYRLGYKTFWSDIDPQALSLTKLRADGAEYEDVQRLVEYLVEETVADRRGRGEGFGLTWEGASKIFQAFGIKEQSGWEVDEKVDASDGSELQEDGDEMKEDTDEK